MNGRPISHDFMVGIMFIPPTIQNYNCFTGLNLSTAKACMPRGFIPERSYKISQNLILLNLQNKSGSTLLSSNKSKKTHLLD